MKYPKTIFLNFDESYYDNQYLERFIENLNELQFKALTIYAPNKKFLKSQRNINHFVDEKLSKFVSSKDHKIYHDFFTFSIKNNFERIIIPRLIQPEFFYSDLLFFKNCPEIILGGGAFELFIRSKSRENIIKNILRIEKVKKLILHTIGGKNSKFPKTISLESKLMDKIHIMSEAHMAPEGSYNLNKDQSLKNLDLKEDFYILFFGTMFYWKGPDVLAEAINSIKEDIKCIYAGNTKTINFDWKVPTNNKFKVFNEYIPEKKMYELFNIADLVVCPYRKTYEYGSSNVFLQSLLANKPVIAPDLEPFSNVIKNYKCGELFESENINSLKKAINKILNSGTSKYTKGIKKYFDDQHNWNNIINTFLE